MFGLGQFLLFSLCFCLAFANLVFQIKLHVDYNTSQAYQKMD